MNYKVSKCLILVFLAFCVSSLYAQKIIVYSVMGNVTEIKNGSKNKVLVKAQLAQQSYIIVESSSRIILLDDATKEMYTINGKIEGKLCQMMKSNNVVKKKLSPQYFSVLMKKLSSTNSRNTYMQSAATSFRDTDELLEKIDSLRNRKDSIEQQNEMTKNCK